jgi:TolB-like protein
MLGHLSAEMAASLERPAKNLESGPKKSGKCVESGCSIRVLPGNKVPEKEPLRFAGYTLDFRRGCLRHGNREIALRPKSFSLLSYLVENAGRLVSKEELIEAVWENAVVTDESVARCVSDIRLALGDAGQQLIKTVPRRGYLFAMPVTLWPTPAPLEGEASATPRLSVVVLPFVHQGEGGLQDYFVDALSEGLATDLWRLPGAFVIASRTAFAYKAKAIDTRQIGRELGVRYVVAGSVFDGCNCVLIGVQLIDAATGAILWADRLERRRDDLLGMQGDITAQLARMIGIELVAAESARAERLRTGDVISQDLSMRGRAMLNQPASAETMRNARVWFEEALRLDERNLDALVGLSWTLMYEVSNYLSDRRAEQTQAAEASISKALALAPRDGAVHLACGDVWRITRSPESALRAYERALAYDHGLSAAHGGAGLMKIYLGRPHEAEAHVEQAIRLNPLDPRANVWHFYAGIADFFLGRIDHAAERFRKGLELNPSHELTQFYLAAALAETGRRKEAAAMRETARSAAPHFSIAKYLSEAPSDEPVYVARREPIVQAMRKAGVPDELTK